MTDALDWSNWTAAKAEAEREEWWRTRGPIPSADGRRFHARTLIMRAVDGSDDATLREQGVPESCWPPVRGEPGYHEGDPPEIIISRTG